MKVSNLQLGHWFFYVAPIPALLWLVSLVLGSGYPIGMGPTIPMILFGVLPSSVILTVAGLIVAFRKHRQGQSPALIIIAVLVSGAPLLFLVYGLFRYFNAAA